MNHKNMTITSTEAAKKLCELSNWSITNLKLQKLMYLSHLFFLGRYNTPLVSKPFEAWKFGPVSPVVYERTKIFQNRPVLNIFYGIRTIQDDDLIYSKESQFLKESYQKFMQKSARELVEMTHLKGGAWDKAYSKKIYSDIKDSDILQEYKTYYKNDHAA